VRQIKLTSSQLSSVNDYCKLNNIEDVDKFISKCFTNGLNIEKYGLLGDDSGKTGIVSEKQVEIEVIREIRVEVPVEVIKEVEVIREVIKEIVKEVPVETIKEVEVIKYVDREVRVDVPVPIIDEIGDKPEPIIVEKIVEVIKEVPVEKPNDKVLLLQETLQTLKKELSLKNTRIEELENKNKQLESIKVSQGAVYLKGSNLNKTM
jgi:hypothetical protein